MPLSRIFNPLNLTKLILSSFSGVASLTVLSPSYGTEPFPNDIWGEISNHLPYHVKVTLSATCKNQLGLLRNREAAIKRQFEELPKNSELFKAYQNLPESCKTSKILLRLTEQAELICCFLHLDEKLYPFIEFFSAKGVWQAMKVKIRSLTYGFGERKPDPAAAKAFIEEQITKGIWQAIEMKINCFWYGTYGYDKDLAATKALIDEYITKGVWQAIKMKIYSLAHGSYGDKQDPAAAKAFIEEQITKGFWQAIEMKIEGLDNGFYGYERDPNAAIRFIFRYLNFPI